MTTVVLYGLDTMADWEYAYLTQGLTIAAEQGDDRYRFVTAGPTGTTQVTTTGRLRLLLDTSLDDIAVDDIALLVLPGGESWGEGHEQALDLARRCVDAGTPVAAICGATLGLARTGLLDDREHTSNAPEFLATAPGYAGAALYREARTVVDRGVITAPATAPVDFARAVFEALELFPPEITAAWYGLYTTGERRYYDQLVGAGA
jgi:putative intracellular protease/amidase